LGTFAALLAGLTSSAETAASSSADVALAIPAPVLRRLNRIEYSNSLRDLFGIEFPFITELPADGQAEGFDNIGDALSLSPVLLESYLKVARKVSDLILGTGSSSPITDQFLAADSQSAWQEGMPIGTRGGASARHYFPREGEYELRAILDNQPGFRNDSLPLTPVEGVRLFRMKTHVPAGPHTFIATFPELYAEREGPVANLQGPGGAGLGGPIDIRASAILPTIEFWLDGKKIETFEVHGPTIGEAAFEAQTGPPTLARLEITGPFNSKSAVDTQAKRRLLGCSPKLRSREEACATSILTPVARRAYRREVDATDMTPILAAFKRKRPAESFEDAIGMGLRTILMSPDFLFKVERAPTTVPANQPYRISDFELAARLSYFIWSSIPDDELLEQAEHNRLQDRAALEQQVRRMLDDPRSYALVDNFAIQWLGLRDFESLRPDDTLYPEFDKGLGRAFQQETRLFLRSILRENRSVLEVISSDYTFLNQRLAEFYGIPGVIGPAFRKVELPSDGRRGGVLGQSSILMATSHAAQTSPVLRGKWVLANLLNSPPNPPPSGVPPLNTKPAADGRVLTTREQIERHQISPVCTACHAKMDPYGIAMENYDVMGRWRTEENGSAINASTALPRGETFSGPVGLRKILLARSDEFAKATVSRLMTYALGRRLQKSDADSVKEIVAAAKPNEYRFADLVLGIINSAPFQMRQTPQLAIAQVKEP
jgi:hypothetical protein